MTLPVFDLHRPLSIDEALGARNEDAPAFAGGTELLLAMRMGLLAPDALVDVKRLPELRVVEADGARLRIGAAVTHDEVANSPAVQDAAPMLASVADHVGNPRVRAQGTIGGNIVFAEPKSDVIAALIALDAVVELRSAEGERTLPIADFVLGAYWTDIGDDELLVAVEIPRIAGRKAVYEKFQTMERPTVGVALRADPDGACRLVVAAVCGEPYTVDAASIDELDPAQVASAVDVIPDLTGGERYKRHLTQVVIHRAISALRALEAR